MHRPFTIEIIGPAGTGKSSLMALLRERDAQVRTGLSIWRLPAPLLAAGAISATRDLLCARGLTWEDKKLVIQTHALQRLLSRELETHGQDAHVTALLLDEGLVFALAKLIAFNAHTTNLAYRLYRHTAPALDAVVWLDASDEVLATRIRQRSKSHRVKHSTDTEIYEHLARYRRAFDVVIQELSACAPLKVTRFNTAEETLDSIAGNVLDEINKRVASPFELLDAANSRNCRERTSLDARCQQLN